MRQPVALYIGWTRPKTKSAQRGEGGLMSLDLERKVPELFCGRRSGTVEGLSGV
jgi:hypothetical protein